MRRLWASRISTARAPPSSSCARSTSRIRCCAMSGNGVWPARTGAGGVGGPVTMAVGADSTVLVPPFPTRLRLYSLLGRPTGQSRKLRTDQPRLVGSLECPQRGCSSAGRASASQAEGRGFEPRRPLRRKASVAGIFFKSDACCIALLDTCCRFVFVMCLWMCRTGFVQPVGSSMERKGELGLCRGGCPGERGRSGSISPARAGGDTKAGQARSLERLLGTYQSQ
jgi:hypothetical protein